MPSSYTARDIITGALRLISVTDSNQTLDGPMVEQALYTMQEILDSWNVEGGMIYSQETLTFPILTSKQFYSIGPVQDNPGYIESLNYTTLTSTSGFTAVSPILNQSLTTNGNGVNAKANIIVENGYVIDFQITNVGSLYQPGDILTFTQGGASASIAIATTAQGTDFVVPTRPQNIIFAAFQPPSTTPTINLPLKIVTAWEYAQTRAQTIQSEVPSVLYMDNQYPVANIYLWTEPNMGGNLVLTVWNLLPSFGITLDTVIGSTFPPGYMRLLRYEIAMNIAPEYGKPIPMDVAEIAAQIKHNILVNNMDAPFSEYEIPGQAGGAYDAITDTLWR